MNGPVAPKVGARMSPTPPGPIGVPYGQVRQRLTAPRVEVDEATVIRLRGVCPEILLDDASTAEAGRDWWPLAIRWADQGAVPALPHLVARPSDASQVAAVLGVCNEAGIPVTAAAGRSGVCGGSVPAYGGVALDMTGLEGVTALDSTSMLADVLPGTFGPDLETALRSQGTTLGHWPQSMDLSTVGGWLACRGAGQYSTRYGKIEDMVVGLEVALADGRIIRTGGTGPRAATGPDLTQMFVGSEGTLGIITSARLRLHRVPPAEARRAYAVSGFAQGLDVCRHILQRGGTPAVLRLYDQMESARNFGLDDTCAIVILDEADPAVLAATMQIVDTECAAAGAQRLADSVVERWVATRNDVSALAPLYGMGIVVDTAEISARWSALPGIYEAALQELNDLEGTLAASAHESHAYIDGACLYFTFAGQMPGGSGTPSAGDAEGRAAQDVWAESYYTSAWDRVMEAVSQRGGAISHHHGIGINRARFMAEALGGAFDVLCALKTALDPRGILNPGKLGMPTHFGQVGWP